MPLATRDFRAVTASAEYQRLFPRYATDPRRDTALEIETTLRGSYKAVSTGGPATGFGADFIIIDDLMKAGDARSDVLRERARAYYDETLYSRLNDKQRGAVVAIQQRLHEDDFVAHLLGKGDFDHLNLPAIAEESQRLPTYFGGWFTREPGDILAPALESRATLEVMRRDMGPAAFSAQYRQSPTPPGGNRIRWEWFATCATPLSRTVFQSIVQSWDTGMTAEPTSDWSVGMTFGFHSHRWHLLDVLRRRMDYPELKREVIRLARHWQPDTIIIEDAATGKSLYQELRGERSSAASVQADDRQRGEGRSRHRQARGRVDSCARRGRLARGTARRAARLSQQEARRSGRCADPVPRMDRDPRRSRSSATRSGYRSTDRSEVDEGRRSGSFISARQNGRLTLSGT